MVPPLLPPLVPPTIPPVIPPVQRERAPVMNFQLSLAQMRDLREYEDPNWQLGTLRERMPEPPEPQPVPIAAGTMLPNRITALPGTIFVSSGVAPSGYVTVPGLSQYFEPIQLGVNVPDPAAPAPVLPPSQPIVVYDGPLSSAPTNPLYNNWFARFSNFSAGIGDTVSMGLTSRFRQWADYDDVVNYQSGGYQVGVAGGTAINVGLSVASPCALARTTGNVVRGLNALQAVGGSINAGENLAHGNYAAAGLDILGVIGNASQAGRSCFAAGTPLLTPDGEKFIEDFQVGDLILSAPEDDPEAAVEAKQVEEVFVRVSPIMNLHVRGRIIRTTAEHPFYVEGRGWIPTGMLEIGDLLRSHDGQIMAVEGVADSSEVTTVYNLRIADHHTYFVGACHWGFSVWAHNNDYGVHTTSPQNAQSINVNGLNPESYVQPFPGTPQGLSSMENFLHTGGAYTGATGQGAQIIFDITSIAHAPADVNGGIRLAEGLANTNIIHNITDPGNAEQIAEAMAKLFGLLH